MTDYDRSRPLGPQLTGPLNEALSQPVPRVSWRRRLARWLARWVGARLQLSGREATDGGYWGGVVMRFLGFVRRTGANAAAFMRRS